jgi:hypothetical protein
MKRQMFGITDSSLTPPSVQILTILDDDVGSQTIDYDSDRGINVSGWSVKLKGDNPSGFTWANGGQFTAKGILGLTWQPNIHSTGSLYSILSADLTPTTPASPTAPPTARLKWASEKDFGVKAWLDANWNGASYDNPLDIYVDTACLRPYGVPTAVIPTYGPNKYFYVDCYTTIYNTPNQRVPFVRDDQNIFVTNYPQSMNGMIANLFSFEMEPGGTLNSDAQPFMLRTGRVQAGTNSDGSGTWTVNVSGMTDFLKIKTTGKRFTGHLAKYKFNSNDSDGYYNSGSGRGFDHAHHMYVVESASTGDGYTVASVDLATTSGYVTYDTQEEIQSAVITALDAARGAGSINGVYRWYNGDLVLESGTTFAAIGGIIPWIIGIGYVHWRDLEKYCESIFNTAGNPEFRPFREDGNYRLHPVNYLNDPAASANIWRNFGGDLLPAYIRPSDETPSLVWEVGTEKLVRNKCTSPYFVQYDLSDSISDEIPHQFPPVSAATSTRRVYMDADEEGMIEVGGKIAFGAPFNDSQQRWGTVAAYTRGNGFFDLSTNPDAGQVEYMPWGMAWPLGLQDALQNDPAYIEAFNDVANAASVPVLTGGRAGVRGSGTVIMDDSRVFGTAQYVVSDYFMDDPFAMTDVTTIRASSPVSILKDLFGDKDVTSVGLSDTIKQTDTNDIVNRGQYNHRQIFDWDALQAVIDASGLSGCVYTLKVRDEESSQAAFDELDVDLIQAANSLALTHGGRMVFGWNETHRCPQISFERDGVDSLAGAIINGRIIESGEMLENTPATGEEGGEWHYAIINCEYGRQDGGKHTFNTKNREGRIRHTTKDKALQFSDTMTLLPISNEGTTERLVQRFASYAQRWSTVQYVHEFPAQLSALRRVEVGKSILFESEASLDRPDGVRNNGQQMGEVRRLEIMLGGERPSISVGITTEDIDKLAIGPSMYLSSPVAGVGNRYLKAGLSDDPANNNFGDPLGGLPDLAYFGCVDYIDGSIVARDCSCTDYAVTIFERTNSALYFDAAYLYASQNVFRATIEVDPTDLTGLAFTIAGNKTAFDTVNAANGEWVIQFSHRADANLQTCQTRWYGWLGQPANGARVTDSGGTKHPAITVGL